MHVHVASDEGEAKYWLEPMVALAASHGFSKRQLRELQELVEERTDEIVSAWRKHFGS